VAVFNSVVALRNFNEYNIIIIVFEFQIRHLAYENSNITLYETTGHSCLNFSMAPDIIRSFMLSNSSYNVTWVNGENSVSTFYNIILDENYILLLDTTYFDVYFGIFTYDGLGLDRDSVRFTVNGDRKDFGFVLLEQNSNALIITDYFGQTLYSATVNLDGYSEWNMFVTIYTLYLFNNYSFSIEIKIERNGIEVVCALAPQSFFAYRFLPNVEYDVVWSYENGTRISSMDFDFEDNGQIISFGFYDVVVPYNPDPLVANTTLWIMAIIIIAGGIIGVMYWVFSLLRKNDRVPEEIRPYLRKKKNKKPIRNVYDGRLLYK
jgi:hypothetical protein